MSADCFPCLEARILGGAFLHECWGCETGGRLIGLCESSWMANQIAKALAEKEPADSSRYWCTTDARGEQQHWNRKRVDCEAAKAAGGGA